MSPITLCLVAIVTLGGIFLSIMSSHQTGAGMRPGEIPPRKAYLVFTRESWGCLGGQEIVADVTPFLTAGTGEPPALKEVKNPEDVGNRNEFYLYYPARELNGLPGFLVLRLGVAGREVQASGTLRLTRAVIARRGQGFSFTLIADLEGVLQADLLYADAARLESGLFTCPAADLFTPHPVKFLPVYLAQPEMAYRVAEQTAEINIPLKDHWLRETEDVAACVALLAALEKSFSSSAEYVFLWDKTKVTPEGLNRIAAVLEQGKDRKYQVALEVQDRQGTVEITRDPTPFDPQVRQTIAVATPQGQVVGGTVLLGLTKAGKK